MAKMSSLHTGRPATLAVNGMIATSHYLATEAGNRVLQQGGSAVDAAIAANAVLCVAYPHMAGLGGDCFWLIWSSRDQKLMALNGSGRSAKAATIDFYRNKGHRDKIPSRGPLAANTVPGTVDGWFEAHQRLGQLEWRDLFDRAILYAEQGMPVPSSTARWLAKDRDILAKYDLTARTFLPHGQALQVGGVLVQKDLARSFQRIADGGRDGFYIGDIAREITGYLQNNGGLLSMDDFSAHHSDWVEPIKTSYRDVEVYTFPPNTQGLSVLLILNMIEGIDIDQMGDVSADYIHTIVEATKIAFADRDRWVTDPEKVQVPMDRLLAKDYAEQRRQRIDPRRALKPNEVKPGIPGSGRPGLGGLGPGTGPRMGGDTIYLCAVDKYGNAVSLIQSIYHDFGSAVIGGNTGIILQNRGSFFSLDPNHVNRLEPNKRTFHTLMPSMMLKNGRPYIVFGTMGGEGQPQTQTAMVTRMIDFGYNVQQAIEAPRWLYGRAWGEQELSLKVEARFPKDTVEELRRRGHQVEVVDDWAEVMGHAQAISISHDNGVLAGGADPRGDGVAIGW